MSYPIKRAALTVGVSLSANVGSGIAIGYDGALPSAGGAIRGVSDCAGSTGEFIPATALGECPGVSGAAIATVGMALKVDASGKFIPQGGTGEIVARALSVATGANEPIQLFLVTH